MHRASIILSRLLLRLPLLVLVWCAACTKHWVEPQAAKVSTIAAWVDTPKKPYRIEPGDDVSVVMPFNPELNYEAVVDPKGGLTIPLVGTVQAGGLTVDEAGQRINRLRLSEQDAGLAHGRSAYACIHQLLQVGVATAAPLIHP